MKHYLVNSDVKFGKLQANPKVHKSGIPLRTIVNDLFVFVCLVFTSSCL
jgi:hypothetical protein